MITLPASTVVNALYALVEKITTTHVDSMSSTDEIRIAHESAIDALYMLNELHRFNEPVGDLEYYRRHLTEIQQYTGQELSDRA